MSLRSSRRQGADSLDPGVGPTLPGSKTSMRGEIISQSYNVRIER